ncbi:GntR family transcriptional regulator [Clostridium polyendosporum]|uniref:GntR family transcriptional regulator n=1 Tax=Clostridium polyendosporum TaxID=69208 RepID=A0A919RY18_9CLOT|nr:PLP-dependent aminotransferase family protein [Clostridium polyendosporum]GIM28625.1 GntR family transcriptional regulator [Clostridium polyendosporum]
MEKYRLYFNENQSKYLQLAVHIKELIDENQVNDGEKLPSIRELAEFLMVNKVTVINAYKKLHQEGYAQQKMGSGTFAKKKEVGRSFRKDYSDTFKKLTSGQLKNVIDFTGETTSSNFFPVRDLKTVLNDVLDRDGAEALIYQHVLGYEKLRKTINNKFWEGRTDIEDILIVSGAQQGIDIASKALINVNDNVIIEKPTYGGALSVFKWRRANIFEVPLESDGVNLIELEKILKKNKVKCFYLMSYFQNPTGISYSYEKKKEILRLAKEYDFYIIEDDYLSELVYDENIKYTTFKNIDINDRVIYIKSFSKIFLPGIRIGYLITPKRFREAFQNSKVNTDISTSSLMQRALEMYIDKDYWIGHIDFLNKEYKIRYNYMKCLLEEKLKEFVSFSYPGGGLHFFLKINEKLDVSSLQLFYILKERNILITPGIMFFKNSKEGERYFRIGFSQTNCDKIEEGINSIYEILKERENKL